MSKFVHGQRFVSPVGVECEVHSAISELDGFGLQNYLIKVFFEEQGEIKFIFDIAEEEVLEECEQVF